jgi:hypothetical protein
MDSMSAIILTRTDTTLDLSQKAEKGWRRSRAGTARAGAGPARAGATQWWVALPPVAPVDP